MSTLSWDSFGLEIKPAINTEQKGNGFVNVGELIYYLITWQLFRIMVPAI